MMNDELGGDQDSEKASENGTQVNRQSNTKLSSPGSGHTVADRMLPQSAPGSDRGVLGCLDR